MIEYDDLHPIKRMRELLTAARPKEWAGIAAFIVENEIGPKHTICSFVNCDGDSRANRRLVIAAVNALPTLLDALEAFQDVAEQANSQWSDDYLWKKWRLNEQMEKGRAALAKLEKSQ